MKRFLDVFSVITATFATYSPVTTHHRLAWHAATAPKGAKRGHRLDPAETLPTHVVKLNRLAPHMYGTVFELRAPDDDLQRLMAMGVCKGRQIEMIQRGNPLIVKVLGTRIGVSARLAKRILVQLCPVESDPSGPNLPKKPQQP